MNVAYQVTEKEIACFSQLEFGADLKQVQSASVIKVPIYLSANLPPQLLNVKSILISFGISFAFSLTIGSLLH